jgi:hypothetical protein
MDGLTFDLVSLALLIALIAVAVWRVSRRRWRVGPAASGAIYDLLNQDRRNAIEMIVEERAEERRPENADGNLPDLEKPRAR